MFRAHHLGLFSVSTANTEGAAMLACSTPARVSGVFLQRAATRLNESIQTSYFLHHSFYCIPGRHNGMAGQKVDCLPILLITHSIKM